MDANNPRFFLRQLVRATYGLQRSRISLGNRIVKAFKAKMGLKDSVSEEEQLQDAPDFVEAAAARPSKSDGKLLDALTLAYRRLTDGVVAPIKGTGFDVDVPPSEVPQGLVLQSKEFTARRDALAKIAEGASAAPAKKSKKKLDTSSFTPDHAKEALVIESYAEFLLVSEYCEVLHAEGRHMARLESVLVDFPIYTTYLEGIKGIGPTLAAIIISEIDIHKATYVSSLWRYAGLDVVDIKGANRQRGRTKQLGPVALRQVKHEHLEEAVDSLGYNPFLKSKLLQVMVGCFIKCGNPQYRKVHDDYLNRMKQHAVYGEINDGKWLTLQSVPVDEKPLQNLGFVCGARRRAQAARYTAKMFLRDLYIVWRQLEGLEVKPDYAQAKLGMQPHRGGN
jgi:hypothetical protein